MVLVIFEVTIKKDYMDQYLALAASLKDGLAKAEGFIRSERFSSLSQEGKLLSLSFWQDEEAVSKWRNQMAHRQSQQHGREQIFEEYRITVASAMRQYTIDERDEAPLDSNQYFK